MKYEWKKQEKDIYMPKTEPVLINVPKYSYFMLEGVGNPNEASFKEAISTLYNLSFELKMLPKKKIVPKGYFEYAVFPLEGEWNLSQTGIKELETMTSLNKQELRYTLMIRQPSFMTSELALEVIERVKKKKPNALPQKVYYKEVEEGLSVQVLHIGSYDDEPISFMKMQNFCEEQGLLRTSMFHKEIYLSNPQKASLLKLKTVLRYGVGRKREEK